MHTVVVLWQSDIQPMLEIENNTWVRGDVEFLFECSTRYLTSEISS